MNRIELDPKDTTNVIKNVLENPEWRDTGGNVMWNRPCPVCKRDRTYKTKQGYKKSEHTLCRSCANSVSLGGVGNVAVVGENKRCPGCDTWKPTDQFYRYDSGRYHTYCDDCKSSKFRKYQSEVGRFRRYGITEIEYNRMYELQDGKCFICGRDEPVLCIDHDHQTSDVRKLLCRTCNSVLGMIGEDVSTLQNMIQYLEN